jgi:hypothetical protein
VNQLIAHFFGLIDRLTADHTLEVPSQEARLSCDGGGCLARGHVGAVTNAEHVRELDMLKRELVYVDKSGLIGQLARLDLTERFHTRRHVNQRVLLEITNFNPANANILIKCG